MFATPACTERPRSHRSRMPDAMLSPWVQILPVPPAQNTDVQLSFKTPTPPVSDQFTSFPCCNNISRPASREHGPAAEVGIPRTHTITRPWPICRTLPPPAPSDHASPSLHCNIDSNSSTPHCLGSVCHSQQLEGSPNKIIPPDSALSGHRALQSSKSHSDPCPASAVCHFHSHVALGLARC